LSPSPIKVISLARTPQRRAEFVRRNPGLAYEFFDAVDGSTLTPAELEGLFPPQSPYTPGACGNALSHHRLWREIGQGETPVTVAEDDAVFRADFAARQGELLAALPAGWDIVMWGCNFNAPLSFWMPFGLRSVVAFDHALTRTAVERIRGDTSRPQLYKHEFSFGLACYTISPAGARRFQAGCFPIRDFTRSFPLLAEPVRNFAVDIAMIPVYAVANAYFCFPPLVATPNDQAASTVRTGAPVTL
jgi:GR25 family glycosyltransferase involved in LPS biosynthesis